MNKNLERLSEEWKEIDSIILYGAGIVSKICQNLFKKVDIKISFVIDRDETKQGKTMKFPGFYAIMEWKNTRIFVQSDSLFVNGSGMQRE